MAVGESVSNDALWDTRGPPSCIIALPGMGDLSGGPFNFPSTCGNVVDSTLETFQVTEGYTPGDSSNGYKEGSDKGEVLCSEAPYGATGQNPGSVSLESLTEKAGTLGLQGRKRNRSGAARRRASRARRTGAPAGESACGQARQPQSGQPHIQQPPGTSVTSGTTKETPTTGHVPHAPGPASMEDKEEPKGPGKRQRSSGGTPGGG
jgi:hypothetical protein